MQQGVFKMAVAKQGKAISLLADENEKKKLHAHIKLYQKKNLGVLTNKRKFKWQRNDIDQ